VHGFALFIHGVYADELARPSQTLVMGSSWPVSQYIRRLVASPEAVAASYFGLPSDARPPALSAFAP
jgi:hypothetical protein